METRCGNFVKLKQRDPQGFGTARDATTCVYMVAVIGYRRMPYLEPRIPNDEGLIDI